MPRPGTALATLAACLLLTTAAAAQDLADIPRERTFVTVGWSVGSPTLSAPNNGNWYSLGAELRNGIMFVNEPLFTKTTSPASTFPRSPRATNTTTTSPR